MQRDRATETRKSDYNTPASYRIICLLQTLSKILEKLVADKLYILGPNLGLFNKYQCGSLPSISTTDAVLSLKYEIVASQKAGMKASTLLLDIKGGFDNILPKLLTNKLATQGVPRHIVRWILSFLSDRSISLIFPGSPSKFIPVQTGALQGSPLSPILFVIYVSDL